ncbi:hypothetical protein SynBIOSE41_02815 [Synechococcus sp. BIOS-E4-1]|nr:hypothetical protein SynBIOSE41_02815 [Synechococcus sp. BIOS-E4-1]
MGDYRLKRPWWHLFVEDSLYQYCDIKVKILFGWRYSMDSKKCHH